MSYLFAYVVQLSVVSLFFHATKKTNYTHEIVSTVNCVHSVVF
jgi:hypothetical protein